MNTASIQCTAGRAHATRWLRRYGWAELIALVLSIVCAFVAGTWTNNVLLAASAYGASIGYYSALLVHEITEDRRTALNGLHHTLLATPLRM